MNKSGKQRRLRIHAVSDAYTKPTPEVSYLIEGLLTRQGLSICAADPKSGKSTFIRQLVACLADGKRFLGRECQQSKCLLLQVEGDPNTPLRHFKKLQLATPSNIFVMSERLIPQNEREALSLLQDVLKTHRPQVVVIDTLSKYLNVVDSGDNDGVNNICAQFEMLARKFACHLIGVMHTKKRKSPDSSLAQAVLGATAWRGAGEAVIILEKKLDRRRTFQAELREGPEIDETYLMFDPSREELSLGATVEFEREQRVASRVRNTEQRMRDAMLNSLAVKPFGLTHTELLAVCEGKTETKLEIISSLIAALEIVVTGSGVKGDPKRYLLFTGKEVI